MRQYLGPSLSALLLGCALCAPVLAKTRTEPSAPAAPECDMMCEIGAYMARDHMVAAVPADDAAGAPAHPARKAVKSNVPVKPNAPKVTAHIDASKAPGVSPGNRRAAQAPVAPPRRGETLAVREAPVRITSAARTAAFALPPAETPAPQAEVAPKAEVAPMTEVAPKTESSPRPRPRRQARPEILAPSQAAAPSVIPGSAPLVTSQFEPPAAR